MGESLSRSHGESSGAGGTEADGLRRTPRTVQGKNRAAQIAFLTGQGIDLDTAVSNALDLPETTRLGVANYGDGAIEIFTDPEVITSIEMIAEPGIVSVVWMEEQNNN